MCICSKCVLADNKQLIITSNTIATVFIILLCVHPLVDPAERVLVNADAPMCRTKQLGLLEPNTVHSMVPSLTL